MSIKFSNITYNIHIVQVLGNITRNSLKDNWQMVLQVQLKCSLHGRAIIPRVHKHTVLYIYLYIIKTFKIILKLVLPYPVIHIMIIVIILFFGGYLYLAVIIWKQNSNLSTYIMYLQTDSSLPIYPFIMHILYIISDFWNLYVYKYYIFKYLDICYAGVS